MENRNLQRQAKEQQRKKKSAISVRKRKTGQGAGSGIPERYCFPIKGARKAVRVERNVKFILRRVPEEEANRRKIG